MRFDKLIEIAIFNLVQKTIGIPAYNFRCQRKSEFLKKEAHRLKDNVTLWITERHFL